MYIYNVYNSVLWCNMRNSVTMVLLCRIEGYERIGYPHVIHVLYNSEIAVYNYYSLSISMVIAILSTKMGVLVWI